MSTLQFMQRLAALVPRLRLHLTRFRGVLAPSSTTATKIDVEDCPNCGGSLKTITAILEQPVIEKILTHLWLQARAPPRAPARGSQLRAA